MTAYAPTVATPGAPGPKLALVTLVVLAVHALLLFGLPYWARTVPATGGPPVFQIRTIALGPPQPAAIATPATAAPAPSPKPQPRPKPAPTPVPAVDDSPAPAIPDNPPVMDSPSNDTVNPHDSPPSGIVSDVQPPAVTPVGDADARPGSLFQAPPLAVFGGTMPLPPIVPPLPPDQALAVTQQAVQLRPGQLTASDARTPGTSDPIPPVQLPRPAEITYQATVTQDGRRVALPSTINWRYNGQFYDLRWTLFGPAIGDRSRFATGLVTVRGLAPVTTRAMGTDAYNLTFDYAQSRLRSEPLLSASAPGNATPAPSPAASAADPAGGIPLPPGAQDPLSVLIQLGALIAGNPSQYPVGSRLSLPVAGNNGPALQTQTTDFTVADDGDFTLGEKFTGQHTPAVHLVHEPVNDHDARIELWLGKRFDYLPIRLLVAQSDGDRLDMTLQKAYTQTVPPSPSLPASASASAGDAAR